MHQWRSAAAGQHPAHKWPLHGDAEKQARWEAFCGRIALLPEIILTSGFIDFSRESLFHLSFHFVEKHHHEEGVKRKRGPAKSVCPYYKASALQQMRDVVLGAVHDIEQLLKLGRETHSCPYYSTRLAIPPAQVTESPVDLSIRATWLLYFSHKIWFSFNVFVVCLCWCSWLCYLIKWCFMKLQDEQQVSS